MIKRNFIFLVLVITISLAVFNNSITKSETSDVTNVSDVNNDVKLNQLLEYEELKFDPSTKKFIILNIWASWCIPCQVEVEELKKISKNTDYLVFGVLVEDSVLNGELFIEEYGIKYFNILNEDESDLILSSFAWAGIPTTIILNNKLEIIYTINGPITAVDIFELTN